MSTLLTRAREARAALIKPATDVVALAETESRDLTPEESTLVGSFASRTNPDVAALDQRIADLEELDARTRVAAPLVPVGGGVVRSEPMTYGRHDRRTSYFRDLGLAYVGNNDQARQRLARHRQEMDVEIPRLPTDARRLILGDDDAGHDAIRSMDGSTTKRDITRVDGAGGEFVPPLWFIDQYAEMIRAGRATANLVRTIPLPAGTDSINLPRITTGTSVAAQTADNGAVSETDIVSTSVAGPVRTLAGQQDIALQLLEQSPIMFDEVIFSDLTDDYNAKLDVQVIGGSGASGQHTGFLVVSGSTSVSYTDASPTIAEFWPTGAQLVSQTVTARKRGIDCFVMHPRRWYWMQGQLDGSSRPYVVPIQSGPQNAMAAISNAGVAEGPVGFWHGIPVVLDPNMNVLLTAGSGSAGTEDAILALKRNDHILFEGALRTRALPDVGSGTLTVRLQVYAYSAFICGRFPAGVGKLIGTGMAAPSGY